MKKWSRENRKTVHQGIVFKHDTIETEKPDGSRKGVFDLVICSDWVNIVALNEEGQLIMVKQYRHGIDDITLETPAGAVEKDEDKLVAAKRELEEETGFISDEWSKLGEVDVNPAFMTNKCHYFLAKNCKPLGKQNFDPFEEIEVELHSQELILDMIRIGRISHSLTINSLFFYKSFS